jgi:hypothetical protein
MKNRVMGVDRNPLVAAERLGAREVRAQVTESLAEGRNHMLVNRAMQLSVGLAREDEETTEVLVKCRGMWRAACKKYLRFGSRH